MRTRFGFLAVLLVYAGLTLHHLDRTPPVHEDEPWIASLAWKVSTEGVFGSDMLRGYYNSDTHHSAFPPLYPLLLAPIFKVAGVGVLQGRLVNAALGAVLLTLLYTLTRRLFDSRTALVSVWLLLTLRLHGVDSFHPTGVLFLDLARISRYDILVAVCGFAALQTFVAAEERHSRALLALAGLLAGLAGVTNSYGVVWVIILFLLAVWNRSGVAAVILILIAGALPWIAFALYIATDLESFWGQTREWTVQTQFLNPAWHLANLLGERHRYSPGLGVPDAPDLLRVGLWTAGILGPVGVGILVRRALIGRDRAARLLVLPLLIFPSVFALVVWKKHASYAIAFLPCAVVAVALGIAALMAWLQRQGWVRTARFAAPVLLAAITLEGASRWWILESRGRVDRPYDEFIRLVHAPIPPGSRVLGLQKYWFGMQDVDYRTWLVPFRQVDPRLWSPPLSMAAALDLVRPDWILVDKQMRGYLSTATPDDSRAEEILAWMRRRGYSFERRVAHQTYGPMDIYHMANPPLQARPEARHSTATPDAQSRRR